MKINFQIKTAFVFILFIALFMLGITQCENNIPIEKIIFTSDRGGVLNLFIMNFDGSEQRNITNMPASNTQPGINSNPIPSPDGRYVAFVSNRDNNNEIYVINIENESQENLTKNMANDFSPSWSPDGKHIAFISDRNSVMIDSKRDIRTNDIYIMDSDGTNVIRFTDGNMTKGFSGLSWSPDGLHFLVSMSSATPQGGFFSNGMNIINFNDKKLTQLDSDFYSEICCQHWSPDGKTILFAKLDSLYSEIYTIDVNGKKIKALTNSSSIETDPYWARNGKEILFSSNRDGAYHIYIMKSDGTNQTRLTNGPGQETNPVWLTKQ